MVDKRLEPEELPYPLPPWRHRFRTLSVYCEVDEAALARRVPAPLSLCSNIVQVTVMHFESTVPDRPYFDSAVIARVRYGERTGGNWVHAFTSTDQVVSGTREIWGYNMKLVDMSIMERADRIEAHCLRLGKTIISLDVNVNNEVFESEDMYAYPRIFLKGIPDASHTGYCRHEVIKMHCRPDEVRTHIFGVGEVSLGRSEEDPLHALDIVKVFGATFTTGHQTLPWGETLT